MPEHSHGAQHRSETVTDRSTSPSRSTSTSGSTSPSRSTSTSGPTSPSRSRSRGHDETPAPGHAAPPAPPAAARKATLRRFLEPRASRAQLIIGVLCALVGLGLVTQVRQQAGAQYADLRQDELVQVLNQLTTHSDDLARQQQQLESQIAQLKSGVDQQRAAESAAAQQRAVNEVLAGSVPVQGPGVVVLVTDPEAKVPAAFYVHLLEELRNAGAEAIEVGGQRVGTSSWIADGAGGFVIDGVQLTPPYEWRAIGDPQTIDGALSFPGGAIQSLESNGATVRVTQEQQITIDDVIDNADPKYAKVKGD